MVADISGGVQRRLQLAAVTVHDPELLFVDEPTAHLDPILRRRAFDGEFIQLGGDPGDLGARLEILEKIGCVVEIRRDKEAEEAVSSGRLAVEDADVAEPKVLEALNGADGRSLGVLKPSFDEVFFRPVKGTSETP